MTIRHTIAAASFLIGGLLWAQTPPPPELPSGWTDKQIVHAERDMVAAANPNAVQAGVEILAMEGSAVDAAVAVQMILNLVEPQSSGIGGGAFMLHYTAATDKVESYDGRETAPATATPSLFLNSAGQPLGFTQAVIGGRSVGTPGTVRLLELAHREHGRLPWATLFEPAIKLAEAGFPISPRLFTAISGANAELRNREPTRSYFFNPDGTPKAVGTILRNPEFAATLRTIAANGANAFYTGPIAADIVATVQGHPTNPGLLSLSDLANYQAKKREPVCGTYRVIWTVCGMSMPSSGGTTVLQTLGILENFNVRAVGPNTADSVHLISEAYRLAYADRAVYEADPDFVNVPVAGLIDKNYLRQRSTLISMTRSMGTPVAGKPPGCCASGALALDQSLDLPSTSHMSIVDKEGNAVSMTTTIESGMGSHQMTRGFLLNNELTDFSFVPANADGTPIANRVEAGKRPRSSMAPTLVFDPKHRLHIIVGSPGGSAIIQYVTKTLVGVLDWDLNIQQAINLGNFGAQVSPTTQLERGSPIVGLQSALQARGHTVSIVDINSGIHGIMFVGQHDEGNRSGLFAFVKPWSAWSGGADPRREGTAAGHN